VNEIELEKNEKEIYYKVLKRIKEIDKEKNLKKIKQQHAFEFIGKIIKEVTRKLGEKISINEEARIKYFVYKNYFGFGKIEPLLYDKDIKYIFCERPGLPIIVFHKNPSYGFMKTNIVLKNLYEYNKIVENLKLKSKVIRNPPDFFGILGDDRLVEISDVHNEFSITTFARMPLSPKDLIKLRLAHPDAIKYLSNAIKNMSSIIIIGGNASQRTTLANSLALLTNKNLKAVVFEQKPEIILPHKDAYYKVLPAYKKKHEHVIKDYLRKNPKLVISSEVGHHNMIIKNIRNICQTFITLEAEDLDNAMRILNEDTPTPFISYIDIIVKIKESIGWPRIEEIYEITAYDVQSKMLMISPIFFKDKTTKKWVLRQSKLFSK
ncbi:MAG: type II/IV secretion system ATPase subunit, partial [Nanoarchaeota archaeon]|nr:type II/IV secretion system ATPase subunit [Nanoarchaeota archaeon]